MKLQRQLGTKEVFAVSAGAMISSGLFVLPGLAFGMSGPAMCVAYLLAGILTVPALFSKAELATAMPKAGGIYYYVDRSMGRAMGTLGGLASWFSLSFKSAFALVGIGAFALILFPDLSEFELRLIAAGFCVLFTIINLVSASHAGQLQVIMVAGLFVILSVYIIAGFGAVDTTRFEPFMPNGWGGLLATTGLVFVSFGGLTKAASIAEEVRNPGRDLPRGMFLAFVLVLLLYTLATYVTVGIVKGEDLSGSLTPINLGSAVTLGTAGVVAVTVGAILAFVSTANAGIMASSRVPLAMSRDKLMPLLFGKVDKKRGVPTPAIILTGAFMTAVILFLDLESLVKTASTLKLMLFLLVNVAVILMRESHIHSYRPKFRAMFYPWLQIFGILGYSVLIVAMGAVPLAFAGGFIVISLLWYVFYGRRWRPNDSDAAVIHIIDRIKGSRRADRSLIKELVSILRERDFIEEDRVDRLVESAIVLDLLGKPSMEETFSLVAETLAEEADLDADELTRLLLEHERTVPTHITPKSAAPRIIIEGKGHSYLVVVRCRKGVYFSDIADKVQAMFFLVDSPDKEHFQFQCLKSFTDIVSKNPKFHRRWMNAKVKEDLRGLLLLAERRRHTDHP